MRPINDGFITAADRRSFVSPPSLSLSLCCFSFYCQFSTSHHRTDVADSPTIWWTYFTRQFFVPCFATLVFFILMSVRNNCSQMRSLQSRWIMFRQCHLRPPVPSVVLITRSAQRVDSRNNSWVWNEIVTLSTLWCCLCSYVVIWLATVRAATLDAARNASVIRLKNCKL